LEKYDNRVAPRHTDRTELIPYHNARFVAACDAIKDEDYIVWVIGFGATPTDEMEECATGKVLAPDDSKELSDAFRFIASQIADLRLGE
ncbi:hypothetical protein, partial [Escherichia coli]|uniref:hypothetical protein n=1 Tax=Escherichia coli TaxID=562 RepID=UPI001101E295